MARKAWLIGLCLAVVATTLAAIAPASEAAAQTKLAVAKVANDFALSMVNYGNKLGTFQKNGLDVTVSSITQAKMVQAVIAGSIDIGLASGATLAYAAKGAPLTGVAALSGPPSILVLVVGAQSPIKSLDQLRNRTVAVSNLGSLTDWAVSQIAAHEKWPSSDIKRVSVGDTAARVATLRTGAADAAVVDIAAALNLEERGQAKILVNFGDLITAFQNQVIYASNNLIKSNPNAVRDFVSAWFQTIQYARSHKAETVAFAQSELDVTPGVATRVYDELMPGEFFSKDGRFDPAVLKAMSKGFVEMKLLDHEADLSQYVTNDFLPKLQ
ncbi:MAG TPA: ABC transporter substrate-binding protein [Xanthobacteraceae bacterium]|nr:ABC transporter substrate-binding protein [Xanthobacteraceae bacterium]